MCHVPLPLWKVVAVWEGLFSAPIPTATALGQLFGTPEPGPESKTSHYSKITILRK